VAGEIPLPRVYIDSITNIGPLTTIFDSEECQFDALSSAANV
jgi:hypothetical protein